MNLPILIPSYNPNDALIGVVNSLVQAGAEHIIVIDDGSKPECGSVFEKLSNVKQCYVLHHAVNLGKGRALKTGMNYCYLTYRDAPGIVTADADGQHLAEDIVKVGNAFLENPKAMVIGTRTFGKGTPLRSLIGNVATRYVFRVATGISVSDTQSGLRCIPRLAIKELIGLDGERYEYEMNMLISMKKQSIAIDETAIQTVYIEDNESSHFNPLIDSMRIYFLLLRFTFSSMFASAIDFVAFAITYKMSADILISIVVARMIAGNINFAVNKKLVFHSSDSVARAITKYYALFVVMGSISYLSIRTLADLGVNVLLAKIATETLLFIASFAIQRDFIFSRSRKTEVAES